MHIVILAFLTGSFAGGLSFAIARILYKSRTPEMCHKECERIKDLHCENVNLEKQYKIVMNDNKSILNNQTKYLTDISKELKK